MKRLNKLFFLSFIASASIQSAHAGIFDEEFIDSVVAKWPKEAIAERTARFYAQYSRQELARSIDDICRRFNITQNKMLL